MKIFVINCGSSSIKYALFNVEKGEELARGIVERIGEEKSVFIQEKGETPAIREVKVSNHRRGLQLIIEHLLDHSQGVIKDISEISVVGHRVVHGGDAFFQSTMVTEKVIQVIKQWAALAPLHNYPNLIGIEAAKSLIPKAPHVAVFDTAFHQTMPKHAYMYAVPYEYYDKYRIRRYGFHGTSHRYVSLKAAEVVGKELKELRIITCHLGNGCSMTAVAGGKSIDTSMGLTPLEGLVMGTRSGDIDPSIAFFIAEKEGLSLEEIGAVLNRKSGLLGVSGVSNDMREVLKAAAEGNTRAKLAIELFTYRVKKYIGAYAAALGGLDILVFTGGIGENAVGLRSKICSSMDFLGIHLDEGKNNETGKGCRVINSDVSKVKVLVIPTDEELLIAHESLEVVKRVKCHEKSWNKYKRRT